MSDHPQPIAAGWPELPAAQQPHWREHRSHAAVVARLRAAQPLVTHAELVTLGWVLAGVALGGARVAHLGDCAESFYESSPTHIAAKLAAMDTLADVLAEATGQGVVRLGRMGGQYAKPRSNETELVDGVELPVFRGHMVNLEAQSAQARRADPRRMMWAYQASRDVLLALRAERAARRWSAHLGPWSSHEALVLDYETNLVRVDPTSGVRFLGSTHFPWIGERTRQLDHAHVALMAAVANPIGCKIGPSIDPETALRLCDRLDPDRVPGRLTLIVRMGREHIRAVLPAVVEAVARSGHPVVWVSDPMHGNAKRASCGLKTRYLDDLVTEAREFRRILEERGQHVGGVHLEVAADDVTECIGGAVPDESALRQRYLSLCDPRLTVAQAAELIDATFTDRGGKP